MSKRDYETIALALRESEALGKLSQKTRAAFVREMADTLASDNPRFDRVRFIRACQPRWTVGTTSERFWDYQVLT
jgi:hypothetical protein